jgi:hypothetical protein
MKSQKDSGGLFALIVMENADAVANAIANLHQSVHNGQTISVFRMVNR